MPEYIDRELTVQKIVNIGNENYEGKYPNIGMVHAAQIVKSMPSADVAPVIHAKWEYHGGDDDMNLYGFCSNCHKDYEEDLANEFDYCPKCGAKMD